MDTVFWIPSSSKVTVSARLSMMRSGPDVHRWNLLYGLLARASADRSNVVAKDSLSMKT